MALLLLCTVAAGKEKPKKTPKAPPPAAVVAGTVFRDSGFALPGAEVSAEPDPAEGKKRGWKTASDARGEFVLRLPPGPASYNVVVRANGFKTQEKKVTFAADERLDFNFLMDRSGESK